MGYTSSSLPRYLPEGVSLNAFLTGSVDFVPLGEAEQEHQTEQQNSKHSKDLAAIVPCSALFAELIVINW